MFSLWEKPKEDVCLLLDIGNGSVGGSFVRFKEGHKPELIYSVRYPIHIPEKPTSTHLFNKMAKLLDEMLRDLSHRGYHHISTLGLKATDVKHVFCIFSTPWYTAKSKTLRVEKKEPIPVTEEFIRKLLAHEKKTIENKVGSEVEFIEQKVVRAKLNGFETHHPYGQIARTIELSVFMSMVPQTVLNQVEKLVSRYFNSRFLAFHSFALMSYNIIEDLFPNEENYVFMDITGEVTELAVVSEGVIANTLSFPYGRNHLMRLISKKYNVSPDVAASYVKICQKGAAESTLTRGVQKAIDETKALWLQSFRRVLGEIKKDGEMPEKIYITIDDDVAPLFSDFLSGERLSLTLSKRDSFPSVTILNKNILTHFCKFGHGSQVDSFLAIESLYFNKIFHL